MIFSENRFPLFGIMRYEHTCLPLTFLHTGRRAGGGLGAAAAGRGGVLAAGGGERGGGVVFIAPCCGGGFGLRPAPVPDGGLVLVTLAPAGGPFARNSLRGGGAPAEPGPLPGGGRLAFKSLPGGGVPVPVGAPGGGRLAYSWPGVRPAGPGVVTSGCTPGVGAIGRAEGGRPSPGLGATLTPGVTLTGMIRGRPGGGVGRTKPATGARANAGSGRNGGGGGGARPPTSTSGRATSGGGTRTNGGAPITTTGPRRGGATTTTPSGGGRGTSQ